MKKTLVVLIALVLCIPVITIAADVSLTSDGKVPGSPFQNLQSQIDQLKIQLQNIQLTPGPQGPQGLVGPAGPAGPAGVANGISQAIHGSIDPTGAIVSGTGFTVNHSHTGIYDINFTSNFTTPPDCIVQYTNVAGQSTPNNLLLQVQWVGINAVEFVSQLTFVEGVFAFQPPPTAPLPPLTPLVAGYVQYQVLFVEPTGGGYTDAPITFICVQ